MQRLTDRPAIRPAIRIRPVPPVDPPFDDEPGQEWPAAVPAGQLTLDLTGGSRAHGARPSGSMPPSRRRPAAPARPPVPADALTGAGPEAHRAAIRFLGTCLEIFNGYRPVWQARRLAVPATSQAVLEQLTAGVSRLAGTHRPGGKQRRPVRARKVRVCEPRPGVAEVAAALSDGRRTWAMAFRLEQRRGAWLTVALRVL